MHILSIYVLSPCIYPGYADMTCHINPPYQDNFATHPITNSSSQHNFSSSSHLSPLNTSLLWKGAPWMMGVPVLQQTSEVTAIRYYNLIITVQHTHTHLSYTLSYIHTCSLYPIMHPVSHPLLYPPTRLHMLICTLSCTLYHTLSYTLPHVYILSYVPYHAPCITPSHIPSHTFTHAHCTLSCTLYHSLFLYHPLLSRQWA